ncbi:MULTISPECIES: AMP-binding protein [Acidianus]|nr:MULTISPECIES: AMP-binding protein [Acidianus]NON61747.1 AMP-binding protein [Acidianus sp. RZ1]
MDIFERFRVAMNERRVEDINSILKEVNHFNPSEFNWVSDIVESYPKSKKAVILVDLDNKKEEKAITYGELIEETNRLLNFLRKEGIKKGDPIYIMTPVVIEQWVSLMAVIKGGLIGVPTAINLTPYELNYRFHDLPPKAIIADVESAKKVDETKVKTLKISLGKVDGWHNYDEIFGESNNATPERTSPKDQILNYFTSGTTGMPKRVLHTAVSYPVGNLSTASFIGIKSDFIHVNLSAPGWAKFAWSSFFSPFIMEATVLGVNYSGKLKVDDYLSVVDEYEANSFCAPPTAWRQFVTTDLRKFKLTKLQEAVSAGEPLNPEVIKSWKDVFNVKIRDFYGQTETTAMIGNFPWEDSIPGSMGRPSPMYDIQLVDDDGNVIKGGEVGHIAINLQKVRPIGLFLGYSDEEKNLSAFRGSMYFTGDKAYVENGRWFFVGRSDDIIKTSDYRVGPFEVESALLEHPAVAEAAVVGYPDPTRWQVVKAYVVLKPGYTPSKDLAMELHEHVKKLLLSYKAPRRIEFVEELPKTISGKIRRKELKKKEEEKFKDGKIGENEFVI